MTEPLFFYGFAAVALVSAILVISRVNPLMSSLWLVVCLGASAGLFALLQAPLLAVLQILVYAGAVMVLFIFVIMLMDLGSRALKARVLRFGKVLGGGAAVYFAAITMIILWRPPFLEAPEIRGVYVTPMVLGHALLTKFAVPFELASLLLLVAIVSAVVMGKKSL